VRNGDMLTKLTEAEQDLLSVTALVVALKRSAKNRPQSSFSPAHGVRKSVRVSTLR
jgi:hypothetical protein